MERKTERRTYALRRVQDAFRANRSVEDPKMVEQLLNQGRDNLDIIRRQPHAVTELDFEWYAYLLTKTTGFLTEATPTYSE
ncbi:unnamed protein product [Coregonus sp. 'balchen']|nr:unnamed protein product [Coregonus sp. 'balchen']